MTRSATMHRPAAYRPRRIIVTVIVVLAAMALGVTAGLWQWGRYETRAAALDGQAAAVGKPVADLEGMLQASAAGPGTAQWRTATVTGVIEPSSLMELRGRSIQKTASLQYLAWLRTSTGRAVLVNLGWQPRSGATPPALPREQVTVTGIVRAFEEDNDKPGTRITPRHMSDVEGEVLPAYLMARSTCGPSGCFDALEPVPTPVLSLGPHVSYALQWWLLAAAAGPLGIGITRRDALHERERHAAETGSPLPRKSRPKAAAPTPRRAPTDEEIEDAL